MVSIKYGLFVIHLPIQLVVSDLYSKIPVIKAQCLFVKIYKSNLASWQIIVNWQKFVTDCD